MGTMEFGGIPALRAGLASEHAKCSIVLDCGDRYSTCSTGGYRENGTQATPFVESRRMGISLTEAVAISKLNVASDGDATEGWESEDEVSLPDTFDRKVAKANSQWI